jgi:histone-lysine N-methyltransferase SETD3
MEYGIKSVTNIETGQLIVHIPLSLLINIEHAVTSEEAGPVLDGLEYLSDTNAMALFVAYERQRGNSQWQPFLDVMPSQFSTSLYMTDGSRNELTGSMFLEFADRRNRAVDKVYNRLSHDLLKLFPEFFPAFSKDDFLWGLSVLWSRTHRVGVKDKEGQWHHVPCLVPIADMFNMAVDDNQVNVECKTNDESTHFDCYTTQPVPNNTQLLVMYATDSSQRHNARLFMDYGFVVEDNPYDSVMVATPKLSQFDDKDKELRMMVMSWVPSASLPFLQMPKLNSSSVMTSELMTIVRILTMRKESLQEIVETHSNNPSSNQDIKRVNQLPPPDELKALTMAVSHLQKSIDTYQTTVEEDEQILNDNRDLTVLEGNIVMLRKEEKKVLQNNLHYLEKHLKRIRQWFADEL